MIQHYLGTIAFLAVVTLNHRLHLDLTPTELVILATVLGIQQVQSIIRIIKEAPGAPPTPEPTPSPVDVG